jgi:hypothetical protein
VAFVNEHAGCALILYCLLYSGGRLQRFAESGRIHFRKQLPKFRITVFVSSAFYMKMIVTKFMFDYANYFF